VILSLGALAQAPSAITVFSENGERFTLTVDGSTINETPSSQVRAENLKGDFFQLVVVFEDESLGRVSQGFMLDPGKEQKARVQLKKNGSYAIRPFGEPTAYAPEEMAAEAPAPAQKPSWVEAEGQSTTSTNETKTTVQTRSQTTGENVNINVDMMGVKMDVSMSVDDPTIEMTQTTTVEHSGSSEISYEEAEVEQTGCIEMDSADYLSVIKSLESKDFDDSKMTQAKQILQSNCMSSEQIRDLLKVFTYEDDKLEMAKYAYSHCSNPQNYWKVNDAFEYETTIEELDEFLQTK
jgi:hypothetical protein